MTTLEQLQRRYTRPYVTLEELRTDHVPHVTTDKGMLRLIRSGDVPVRTHRLIARTRASVVIPLHSVAEWLDAKLHACANNQTGDTAR